MSCLTLVKANLLGILQRLELPNEGHRIPVRSNTNTVDLIKLVIEDQELLPLGVENPSLSSIVSVSDTDPSVGDEATSEQRNRYSLPGEYT